MARIPKLLAKAVLWDFSEDKSTDLGGFPYQTVKLVKDVQFYNIFILHKNIRCRFKGQPEELFLRNTDNTN